MKNFLNFISALFVMFIIFTASSCRFNNEKYEIALITNNGDIDDKGYNQTAWEGIKYFSQINGKTCKYYRPYMCDTDSYLFEIKQAYDNGAKIIVCSGRDFKQALEIAQNKYKEIYFVAVDCALDTVLKNTCVLRFSESQAGFLAGYSAVKEGFRSLGFQGEEFSPEIMYYGFGFIRGAEFAAHELNLETSSINIKYDCEKKRMDASNAQAKAKLWYENGTQVIFACGENICSYIMPVTESLRNCFLIGSDMDKTKLSQTIISSAVKCISNSTFNILNRYLSGAFPGGEILTLNVAQGGVAIVMENARWNSFSYSDYQYITNRLSDSTDAINITLDDDKNIDIFDINYSIELMEEFNTQYVLIDYM